MNTQTVKAKMANEGRIWAITVVNPQGVSRHSVGDNNVHEIKEEDILITGDPYLFYVGRTISGHIVFKIDALIPVEVIYFPI